MCREVLQEPGVVHDLLPKMANVCKMVERRLEQSARPVDLFCYCAHPDSKQMPVCKMSLTKASFSKSSKAFLRGSLVDIVGDTDPTVCLSTQSLVVHKKNG